MFNLGYITAILPPSHSKMTSFKNICRRWTVCVREIVNRERTMTSRNSVWLFIFHFIFAVNSPDILILHASRTT